MALAPFQTEDYLALFFGIEHVTPINADPNFQGVIDSAFYGRLLQGRTVPELTAEYFWALDVIEAGPPPNFIAQPNWLWQQREVLATLVGLREYNYVYSVHIMQVIRNDLRYQDFLVARTAEAMLSKLNREHHNLRNRFLRLRNADLQAAINNQQQGVVNNQLEGGADNNQHEGGGDDNQEQADNNQHEGGGDDNQQQQQPQQEFGNFVQLIESMEQNIFNYILDLYTLAMEEHGIV